MRIDGTAYHTIRPDGVGIAAFDVTPARRVTGRPEPIPKRG
jgi:hypothetical protein